jgi:hypothetical protein
VPASSYVLAVEADGGLYVVEVPVTLAPGQSRSVQLSLGSKLAPGASKGLKTTIVDNPLTATLVILGGATILGLVIDEIDDDDEPVSPTNPD